MKDRKSVLKFYSRCIVIAIEQIKNLSTVYRKNKAETLFDKQISQYFHLDKFLFE